MTLKKIDWRYLVALFFFISMTILLFTNLGYYPLWDDEANTAIFANGVWQTGDTSAVFGHNIWGYRNGIELNAALKNRVVAPLGYYLTAPFLGLMGNHPFYARLPFAITGLFTIAFIIFWLFKSKASLKTHLLVACGFLGNVSFILYCRQCRYYALTMLFSVLICYFYSAKIQAKSQASTWQKTIFLIFSLILLLSAHYIAYAALTSALLFDYLLWERHHRCFTHLEYLAIILSQLLAVIGIVSIWYPLGINIAEVQESHWLLGKLNLLYLFFRDANLSEASIGLVFFAAPLIYYLQKKPNPILLRLTIGCLVIVGVTSFFSPQAGEIAVFADVRYLSFAVPIFIYLCVVTIENCPIKSSYHYLLAGVMFFSTAFNILFALLFSGDPLPPLRSTLANYIAELRFPPQIAYSATADWINKYTKPGETAVVMANYHAYPLMYHAPGLIYGWQFENQTRNKFPHLPVIQYRDQVMPNYFIFFGKNFIYQLNAKEKSRYVEVAHLTVSTKQSSRPEIFLHTFTESNIVDKNSEGVYIFKQKEHS